MDDVTFGRSGRDAKTWMLHYHHEAITMHSVVIPGWSLMFMNALLLLLLLLLLYTNIIAVSCSYKFFESTWLGLDVTVHGMTTCLSLEFWIYICEYICQVSWSFVEPQRICGWAILCYTSIINIQISLKVIIYSFFILIIICFLFNNSLFHNNFFLHFICKHPTIEWSFMSQHQCNAEGANDSNCCIVCDSVRQCCYSLQQLLEHC